MPQQGSCSPGWVFGHLPIASMSFFIVFKHTQKLIAKPGGSLVLPSPFPIVGAGLFLCFQEAVLE